MNLRLEALDTKNPSYDLEHWLDLYALYRGGKIFRDRIHRFLPKNPVEKFDLYEQRKSESSYRSYLGPVIDFYSAWLFSGDFKVRAKRAVDGETIDDVDPIYAEFREDVGGDVDMKSFLKERFTKALVYGRSHWICELPQATGMSEEDAWPSNAAEFESKGFKSASLKAVDACDLYDWEVGDDGLLEWCSVYSKRMVRKSLSTTKRQVLETWHVYDREFCTIYQVGPYEQGERPDSQAPIPIKRKYKHGFLQVPLVTLNIPDGLWIADRVSDPQTAHFRLGSALDWSIKRTCYAMPVFKIVDSTKPPVMGAGYWIELSTEESMEWAAPPAGQFDVISKEVDVRRNDIFRIVHQMAMGLDNNAETVGRSADSKEQDNAATRIMLNAYGAIVTQAIEETYEIVSDAFDDTDVYWSIEGFNGYDTATAPEVIATATNVQLLNIPSKTYLKEIKSKAAIATIPEASQDVKDIIRKEISTGVDTADEMMDIMSAGYVNIQQRTSVQDAADQAAAKSASQGTSGPKRPPSK